MRGSGKLFVFVLSGTLLTLLDQFLKDKALSFCGKPSELIPGLLELTYVENRGMAFGLFEGARWLFLAAALLFLLASLILVWRMKLNKRSLPLFISLLLIASGAVGNGLDRLIHGYVTDYLYIRLIDFPVFNAADIYVCSGAVLAALLLLFVYDEEEASVIFGLSKEKGGCTP